MHKTAAIVTLCFAALCAISACGASAPDYGSYFAICNSDSKFVRFHNFNQTDCKGPSTVKEMPLTGCHRELILFSWDAKCNGTNMWYNNFADLHCTGKSVLTRMYITNRCFNCPNPDCKNP